MSRILLLAVFFVWIVWYPTLAAPITAPLAGVLIFLGGYALLILALGGISRWASGRISSANFHRSLGRFNQLMTVGRVLVPVWLAAGIYLFHWHDVVEHAIDWLTNLSPVFALLRFPDIFIGTLPAFLAWAGLWWSQYPTDRALREQNLLLQLEHDIPVHSPPRFWSYFGANLRLQLLFIFAPIFLLILMHDAAAAIWFAFAHTALPDTAELIVGIVSFAIVILFVPALLVRVLKTESLPSSTLRLRLEEMCRRHRLRYRDILLWHTQGNLGNAAVMGVLPGLRYVLLSDLLLETMPDEQIEAVFAHELGHIVYRHLIWYVIFIVTLLLALSGPGGKAYDYLLPRIVGDLHTHEWLIEMISCICAAAAFAMFFILFGFVSRWFERQADVFASRTLDEPLESDLSDPPHSPGCTSGALTNDRAPFPRPSTDTTNTRPPVSQRGAAIFAAALHRVAVVNNIPVAARSWCHGSIEKRMRYVRHLAEQPNRTARFDRVMLRLYVIIIAALIASAIGAALAGLS